MELGEGEPVGYHVLAYSTRTLHARTLHAPVRDAEWVRSLTKPSLIY